MILNDLCSLSGMTAAMQHFHAALLSKCRLSWQYVLWQLTCYLGLLFFFLQIYLFVSFLSVVWFSGYFLHKQMLLKGEAGLLRSICHPCLPKWLSGDVSVLEFPWKQADGWLHNPQPGSPLGCFSSSPFLLTHPQLWWPYKEPGLLLKEPLSSLETLRQSRCVKVQWEEEECWQEKILYKLWLRH